MCFRDLPRIASSKIIPNALANGIRTRKRPLRVSFVERETDNFNASNLRFKRVINARLINAERRQSIINEIVRIQHRKFPSPRCALSHAAELQTRAEIVFTRYIDSDKERGRSGSTTLGLMAKRRTKRGCTRCVRTRES